jgi:FMN phosphatase YigB (HAD superfamily)
MKTILVDAVNTFVIKWEWINLEMQKILDKFENKKIILTNANSEEKIKFWLNNLPYELFSLEHNPNKTNSKYYKIFLEKYNLKSDDVIYFEHNLEAVKSARSIWINTFHYDKDKKDLESLEKFLINNL